jgi:hypothetical protein
MSKRTIAASEQETGIRIAQCETENASSKGGGKPKLLCKRLNECARRLQLILKI